MKFVFERESEWNKPVTEVEINTLEELIDLVNKEYDRTEETNDHGKTYNNYLGLLITRRDDMDPSKGYILDSGDDYFA